MRALVVTGNWVSSAAIVLSLYHLGLGWSSRTWLVVVAVGCYGLCSYFLGFLRGREEG